MHLKVMVIVMFQVIVEWRDGIGLEPFSYDANTLSRALVLARQQLLRPEAASVKVVRV